MCILRNVWYVLKLAERFGMCATSGKKDQRDHAGFCTPLFPSPTRRV